MSSAVGLSALRFRCLTATVLLAALPLTALAVDARRGEAPWQLCAGCHGFKAEGNPLVRAPALGGRESWYLKRQIDNFRRGIRGGQGDDVHGQRMATMTRGLSDERVVDELVAWIVQLPGGPRGALVTGDVSRGKTLYAPCAACHGANAQGNAALNAPALTRVDDWYQLEQLAKFRDGRRGRHPEDVYGAQMAPMAAVLPDDAAARDVVAWITTRREGS